jgi:hypothetical protein
MKSPVVLVTAALTAAILLAATLVIATGVRGDNATSPLAGRSSGPMALTVPAKK